MHTLSNKKLLSVFTIPYTKTECRNISSVALYNKLCFIRLDQHVDHRKKTAAAESKQDSTTTSSAVFVLRNLIVAAKKFPTSSLKAPTAGFQKASLLYFEC